MERIINFIKYLKNCLLNIIYPFKYCCLSCNKDDVLSGLCYECEKKIKRINDVRYIEGIEVYSYAQYSYTIKKLIFKFKYKNDFNSGEYLANLLINRIQDLEFTYITYVPSSRDSLKKRGYNQCEFIAKKISENRNIPCGELLVKNKGVKEQKSLSRCEREKNVINAFKIKEGQKIQGEKILLIDDVITTGATVRACINELKKINKIDLKVATIGSNIL